MLLSERAGTTAAPGVRQVAQVKRHSKRTAQQVEAILVFLDLKDHLIAGAPPCNCLCLGH